MSGDYDAASIVGQLSGLEAQPATRVLVPPSELAERFCTDGWKPWRERGVEVTSGFCGVVSMDRDPMRGGFDEGYSWMGFLSGKGWRPLAAKGDWPYVVYMLWPAREGDQEQAAIAEYCEADLTIWRCADPLALHSLYDGLRAAP